MEWLGPWGVPAAIAAMAAVGISASGSSSSFTASAAQMQETQGTGQSYDANGNLVANGGGVLGDLTAKNEDITNSIDSLSKLTIDGNIIGNDMVIALEKIKYNTQQMAAGFFKVQGLTGGLSGFGTVEKSSPGLLGLFASSTSIIDTGIKFLAGKFQQYETVQKTNSGIFGLFGSTSTGDKTKALPSSLEDDINQLFEDNIKLSSKALGELTGLNSSSLEKQITAAISKEGFKVSLKDLKGDEVGDAIMSVVSETIGIPLRTMAPFLENFRKIGEGTVGTLLRLNAETTYAQKAFQAMGGKISFMKKEATQASEEQIATAKAASENVLALTEKFNNASEAAKNITRTQWDNRGSEEETAALKLVTQAEEELAAAKLVAADASKALVLAETTNIQANIALTQKLIDNAGGIDKFTEQMDFFQTNFVNAMQTFTFSYGEMSTELSKLGVSTTLSREGFTALVQSINLNKEEGQALYQKLMELAPAFDALQSTIEGWAGEMSDAFLASVENGDSAAQTGEYVAQTIAYSIQKTIYDQGVTAIMNTIANGIIAPIVTGAIAGKEATKIIGELQIETVKTQVKTIATALKTLFDDEGFKSLMDTISTSVAGLVTTAATILPALPKEPKLREVKDASKDASDALEKLVQSLRDLAKTSITDLFTTLISTLKKNADAIKSNITGLKDFIKSMTEFKTNTLLGDKSTLTPAEKYALAKKNFDTTYQKALEGDKPSIDKLQSVSESFLDASRSFYASGTQYTEDFNTVLGSVDTAITAAQSLEQRLETQLGNIYDQLDELDALDDVSSTLTDILMVLQVEAGKTADALLTLMANDPELKNGVTAASLAKIGVVGDRAVQLMNLLDMNKDGIADKDELTHFKSQGAVATEFSKSMLNPSTSTISGAHQAISDTAGGANNVISVGSSQVVSSGLGSVAYNNATDGTKILLKNGASISLEQAKAIARNQIPQFLAQGMDRQLYDIFIAAGLSSNFVSAISEIPLADVQGWAASKGFPAFEQGINFVPEDMVAQIHKGERILPAADNEELMQSVKGNNNQELIQEIRRLNDKVEKLEVAIARGAIINAQATDRNTEAVVGAVTNTGDRSILANRVKDKAQIV